MMLEIILSLALVASTTLTILMLLAPTRCIRHSPPKAIGNFADHSTYEPMVSVQVLVLGDIGRSPRMQYHAISIAKHGGRVDVIGYNESTLHPGLVDNPLVSVVPLSSPPHVLRTLQAKGIPFILLGPLKVLWQSWNLFHILCYGTRPSRWLLVQNPPSIPSLLVALIVCFLRNTHLIIDWHNYGWTVLAGTRGPSHPLVRISKTYECLLGRYAPSFSFTVTDAMARQLRNPPYSINTPIFTLHDRPASIFKPLESPLDRLAFLSRIPETAPHAEAIMAGRTRLIVSSTSWTPDEDFALLLDALVSYSSLRASSNSRSGALPPILALITGKGPQKASYCRQIEILQSQYKLEGIVIYTAWLSIQDYALLLASADLGISLHKSSSGVDLPMKVVDMFGAGLPVLGYCAYESWDELVAEGVNGRGFETATDLRNILVELFSERRSIVENPKGKHINYGMGKRKRTPLVTLKKLELDVLRFGAIEQGRRRWDDEWDKVAGRVLGLCD